MGMLKMWNGINLILTKGECMPDIVFERPLSTEAQAIINALVSVKCGQDVFDAFCAVPTANLKDMLQMITHILQRQGKLN